MVDGRDDRIVTLPNAITVVRLLCVPLFVWLLADDQGLEAAALLAVLGITDWVDGWIARHFDQGSNLGKVIDPVADRVLLIVAGVALVVQGSVPFVVGILVLVRELVVALATLALAAAGAKRIDVQWAGKAGTLAIMVSFPLFLWADSITSGHDLVLACRVVLRGGGARVRVLLRGALHPDGARRPCGRAVTRTSRSPIQRLGVQCDEGDAMKAVILAGGEGTRLRPLTSNQPKPMMPLVNKPMMEHIVNLLQLHGFDDIVVTVAFLANQIRDYFGDGSDFGVTMRYATEDSPLGTAGSVRNASSELDDTFLVISGDVLTDIDLTAFVESAPRRQRHRVDRVEARGEPARVRHRDHAARRHHRALPREADVGPGVLRHDQHRDLRARTAGVRLHPRGGGGRLLRRRVPGAARRRPHPARPRVGGLLGGRR